MTTTLHAFRFPLSVFLIFCLVLFAGSLKAQVEPVGFDHLTIEDGLSQSAVFSIARDQQGFMWFGTLDGLNRYDGYTITIYKNDPLDSASLSHNHVNGLLLDHHGTLWVATREGGLNRYNAAGDNFTRFRHNPADSTTIADDRIQHIYQGPSRRLWISTVDNDLDTLDRRGGHFLHFRKQDAGNDYIRAIYEDRNGNLWLGGNTGGLQRFNPISGETLYFRHRPGDTNSLSGNSINAIRGTHQDSLIWIATRGQGLNCLDTGTGRMIRFPASPDGQGGPGHNFINHLISDNRDGRRRLWLATEAGLDLFDIDAGRFRHFSHSPENPSSLSSPRGSVLYLDDGGNLWLGTLGGGVNKYSRKKFKFGGLHRKSGTGNILSDFFVRSILEYPPGQLWVGSGSGGLNRIERRSQSIRYYKNDPATANSLSHNSVRAIAVDPRGQLWLGTDGGLDRFDPLREKFRRFKHRDDQPHSLANNRVWTIHRDREAGGNILWLGTYGGGLDRLDLASLSSGGHFRHHQHNSRDSLSLSGTAVMSIYEDPRHPGFLWVGTERGLNLLRKSDGRCRSWQYSPGQVGGLTHNTVVALEGDSSGNLWIGTFGGGLNRLNLAAESSLAALFEPGAQSPRFQHYTARQGLPGNIVVGIRAAGNGDIWISTYNGLVRFDPRSEIFETFDSGDGLQSNEFGYGAHYRSASGELFFGGVAGYNAFFPERIDHNRYLPPVVITGFSIFGRPADFQGGDIRLSYRQNHFAFEFAALDYTSPAKNRYAYWLEGVDSGWVDNQHRRFANFTNIDPGEYRFRVKGSNNDGLWNEDGATINIMITPPFWHSLWFRVLLLLAVASALWLIHRLRVTRLLELERLRVRIASDLHDDLGASLTQIAVHSEVIQSTQDMTKIDRASGRIGHLSREIVTALSDIVWSIDARNDTLGDLVDRIRLFAQNVLPPADIRLLFQSPQVDADLAIPVDLRQNIYLIAKEAINNIARHSRATMVEITLSVKSSHLLLEIRDDGIGLDDKAMPGGQGLRNMQLRAARIKAQIHFESDSGLIIRLQAPLR